MIVEAMSRQNIRPEIVEAAEKNASAALDGLWNQRWILDSELRKDLETARELREWADDIRSRAGLVVVAAGPERYGIKAVLDAVSGSGKGPAGAAGYPEILVWDGSLSPADFAMIIKKIESVNTVMIAVSGGEETIEQRAAYALFKQAVFNAHHDKEGEKVYAVCPWRKGVIAADAEENFYPRFDRPRGENEDYRGNSAEVLLLLMIMGLDVEAYLRGFYDVVGSPGWDRGAVVPAFVLSTVPAPEVFCWQRETLGMSGWFARVSGGRLLRMPMDSSAGGTMVMIASDSGHEDIMMPPFEGCDPDGSLEQLLKSEADRRFFDGSDEDGFQGFKFMTQKLDAESAGAMMAYLQMTLWLATFFREGTIAK